jgi:hypothetical protein
MFLAFGAFNATLSPPHYSSSSQPVSWHSSHVDWRNSIDNGSEESGTILLHVTADVWQAVRNVEHKRVLTTAAANTISYIQILGTNSSCDSDEYCCLAYEALETPWPKSATELFRPSDLRLSETLMPTFAVRGCHVVNVTDTYGRILDFLDCNR